jgi:starvation-inducible DNA-binding protein
MNFIIKTLVLAAFFSFFSQISGQETSFTVPTPPVMETPAVTPSTDEMMVEALSATPEITEKSITETAPNLFSEEVMVTTATQEMPNEFSNNGLNIGLSSEVRQKIATILNKLLSDEYVLYTKTLKFHWNVTGIVFHDFHAAFKEQYEKLFTIVDDIAERARALGAPALGSLQEFSTYTRLKEINTQNISAVDMVKQLLADHEALIRTLRANIDETAALGDQGTSNFLQDLIIKHEKIAWMLRATAAQ